MFSKRAKIGQKAHGFIMSSLKRMLKVSENTIETEHGPIYFLHHNNPGKPTLVLIHGFSDIPEAFLSCLFALRKDYNIILPALKGFDQYGVNTSVKYSLELYRDTILYIVDHLRINDFHLGGNSLGGAVTLQIYKDVPKRLKSIILINCAGFEYKDIDSVVKQSLAGRNPFVMSDRKDFQKFKDLIFHKNRNYPFFIETYIRENYLSKSQEYTDISNLLFSNGPELTGEKDVHVVAPSEIKIPTLLLWGESDDFFPLEIAKKAIKEIPQGELKIIKGAGHVPQHEAPYKVQKLIAEFLKKQ